MFGNIPLCFNRFQLIGKFSQLKKVVFMKTAAGHGKGVRLVLHLLLFIFQELDGEFSVPKNAMRDDTKYQGGTGGTRVISTSEHAVEFLQQHRSFSPQFVPGKADTKGFVLTHRHAWNADHSGDFGDTFLLSFIHNSNLADILDDKVKTRRLHVVVYTRKEGVFDIEKAIGFETYEDFKKSRNPIELKFSASTELLETSFTTDISLQLGDQHI